MASRGQGVTWYYMAYNPVTGALVTGDVGNHTLRLVKDGGSPAAPANAPAEVDSTNMPGWYKVTLTDTEATANTILLAGKSSTVDVVIWAAPLTTERLPTAAPGAADGLVVLGLNSAGININGGVAAAITLTGGSYGLNVSASSGPGLRILSATAAGVDVSGSTFGATVTGNDGPGVRLSGVGADFVLAGSAAPTLANVMWDAVMGDHLDSGSTGEALNASSGDVDGVNAIWNYSSTTTMVDPGAGRVRCNDRDWAIVTQMAFDVLADDGLDFSTIFGKMVTGDLVYVQDQGVAANWGKYTLSAPPTNMTGWWRMNVTFVTSSGVMPDNNDDVFVVFGRPAAVAPVTLADGAIKESTILAPAEAAGRPVGMLAMIRRLFERTSGGNQRVRNRTNGLVEIKNEAGTGNLETFTQSTVGDVDQETKGA